MYNDTVIEEKIPMPQLKRTDNRLSSPGMSAETFDLFSEYIQKELGIKMHQNKQVMLQARLMKRLRALGMGSYEEYYEYLFSNDGHDNELPHFVHQVTTNKTDFFREPAHFQYMVEHALPTLINENSYSWRNPLRIWSSACSTGEEPYTLAMVMADYAELQQQINFSILATDISPTVLQTAAQGVYEGAKVDPVPHHIRRKYLLRSKDRNKELAMKVLKSRLYQLEKQKQDEKYEEIEGKFKQLNNLVLKLMELWSRMVGERM